MIRLPEAIQSIFLFGLIYPQHQELKEFFYCEVGSLSQWFLLIHSTPSVIYSLGSHKEVSLVVV